MEPAHRDDAGVDEPTEVRIDAELRTRSGAYSNFVQITHDQNGFVLDFFSVEPAINGEPPTRGVLQSRIHLGHRTTQLFHAALTENLHEWASSELDARSHEDEQLRRLAKSKESDQGG